MINQLFVKQDVRILENIENAKIKKLKFMNIVSQEIQDKWQKLMPDCEIVVCDVVVDEGVLCVVE